MLNHRRRLASGVTLLAAAALLFASTILGVDIAHAQPDSERDAWRQAVLSGRVEAIDSYLAKFPEGQLAARARIHKAELAADLRRRQTDTPIVERLLQQGSRSASKLDGKALGPIWAQWRRLRPDDHGRVQFEPGPQGLRVESAISSMDMRNLPPEMAQKAGAPAAPFITVYGEIALAYCGCFARILEGDGLIVPAGSLLGGNIVDEGPTPPSGMGSVHIYKGDVRLFGLRFRGDENDPLRFAIDRAGDYVLIGGKGQVEDANETPILAAGESRMKR